MGFFENKRIKKQIEEYESAIKALEAKTEEIKKQIVECKEILKEANQRLNDAYEYDFRFIDLKLNPASAEATKRSIVKDGLRSRYIDDAPTVKAELEFIKEGERFRREFLIEAIQTEGTIGNIRKQIEELKRSMS